MKLDRQVKTALILTVVFLALLALLGWINLWKECFSLADSFLDHKMSYIDEDILNKLDQQENYSAEDIYITLHSEFVDNNFLNANETEVMVFDAQTSEVYGNSIGDLLNIIMELQLFQHFPYGENFYRVYNFDSYSIILGSSWEIAYDSIDTAFTTAMKFLLSVIVALAVYCLYIMIFRKKADTKKKVKSIKRIGLIMFVVFEIVIFGLTYVISLVNDYYDLLAIQDQIVKEAAEIGLMSEDEAAIEFNAVYFDDEFLQEELAAQYCDDYRTKLLTVRIHPLIHDLYGSNPTVDIIKLKSNIWDTSLPIEDRIELEYNKMHFINTIVADFLQFVMFIILYLVLMGLAPDNEEKAEILYTSKARKKMAQIIFLKKIAESLTTIVAMSVLFKLVNNNYSDSWAKLVTNTTLSVAGTTSLLAVIIIPKLLRKLGDLHKILVASLSICVVGTGLCIMTGKVWYFILGYIITSFSDGILVNIERFYPLLTDNDKKKGFAGVSAIVNVERIATLLGMVTGGVLVSFFPEIVIYLVSLLLVITCLILSLRIPKEDLSEQDFKDVSIKRAYSDKRLGALFFMILVPFGFISYCFKILIPLNIAAYGLSTTLVSFLLFFRQASVYFFKNNGKSKAIWKKGEARSYVIAGMIITALILSGFYFIKNVYVVFVLTLLLAFVQSGLSTKVRTLLFEVNGAEDERFFENIFISSEGNNMGKSIAPIVSSINICCLSLVMMVGALWYGILSHRDGGSGSLDK